MNVVPLQYVLYSVFSPVYSVSLLIEYAWHMKVRLLQQCLDSAITLKCCSLHFAWCLDFILMWCLHMDLEGHHYPFKTLVGPMILKESQTSWRCHLAIHTCAHKHTHPPSVLKDLEYFHASEFVNHGSSLLVPSLHAQPTALYFSMPYLVFKDLASTSHTKAWCWL